MIKTMTHILRFLIGYAVGITIFLVLIPGGFFELSKLDYLVGYRMLIGSMFLRYAITGVLLLTGIIFMIWSNFYLFFIGKGGPADAFGVSISPRTKRLVTRGPYRFTRNPMVFGAFLIYLSLVMYLNSYFGLFGLLFLFVLVLIFLRQTEEKRLLHDFGDVYRDYKKKVPFIFPLKLRRP